MRLNRDERTNPPAITVDTRNHIRGEYILNERIRTVAIRAPTPTECNDIFHQKLIRVTSIERKHVAKKKDFRNTGMGNL